MTVVLVLLALMLPGQVAPPRPTPAPALQAADPNRIEEVRIDGNRRVSKETIKYYIQSKVGDDLNEALIQRDIKALYAMGYFDNIEADEDDGKTGKILIFTVKEKPLIRTIDYKGLKSVTKSEVLDKLREKKVGMSVESPFDPIRAKKAEAVIKEMLAEKGHQDATVTMVTEDIPPTGMGLTFTVVEGPKIKVQKITFVGNEAFSDGQLKHAMKLVKQEGALSVLMGKDTYHDLKLQDDITRLHILYGDHGYIRTNILAPIIETKKTSVSRTLPFISPPFPFGIPFPFSKKETDRVYITIKIEENSQYRIGSLRITGNTMFNEDQIKSVIGQKPGDVFNESALRKSFESLTKLYGSRGYINFTAVPTQDPDEAKKLVNLTINLDEERQFIVNRITFSGNTTTRDKVIRREVMVDEGQVFNSQLWDISLLRLNQLGFFEQILPADASVKPHAEDNKVDIDLKVKEKGKNVIGFNGGVSGIGGSFLGLSYSTNNFLGLGENLSLELQGGTRQSIYQLSFTEPYLKDRPISTGFSLFSTRLSYDQARDVYGLNPNNLPVGLGFQNRLNFEQDHKGFSMNTSYPMKVFHRVGVSYQIDDSMTTAVNPATQEFFNNIAAQAKQSFTTTSRYSTFYGRSITPTYTFNSVDNPYNPHTGHSFTSQFEFTGGFLGGNVSFYRPSFDFRLFKPMHNRRNVLAMRLISSYVQGFSNVTVPFYQRSFLGGDFDLRGFDFRSISPVAFIARALPAVDPVTFQVVTKTYDDIVYVGGDTQMVFNLEYRIPIVGPLTLSPFFDGGNAWVVKKDELTRQITDSAGHTSNQPVQFLQGTNSGIRVSTGVELQVIMPVINAPFRLVFALNPLRVDRTYFGPITGIPLGIHQPGHAFKFTVGRTF